ncbi:MAG TPA: hypothetical protein VH328_09055, partial [Burkholderiaceae bacterium]|nr:hypothetical protein [Burkholderiaceae bacterium]
MNPSRTFVALRDRLAKATASMLLASCAGAAWSAEADAASEAAASGAALPASGAVAASAAQPAPTQSQGALGATALRERFDSLHDDLQHNAFGRPLVLQATQSGDRLLGEVYAQIDTPFAQLEPTLEGTDHWCGILVLHLNVKRCHAEPNGLDMALGRKFDQPADDAYRLHFDYHQGSATP